ncbi:Sodium/potassium/calcium exchanger 2 [Trichoplax sp. H2]|nr:Sodium/potassium/calcium exchanger 2 [Trichoplax sp. H2]|eukprot:RDD46610.1 Sodium/potassium/calcium exchanger 2 [Trichoplax sp. H2]
MEVYNYRWKQKRQRKKMLRFTLLAVICMGLICYVRSPLLMSSSEQENSYKSKSSRRLLNSISTVSSVLPTDHSNRNDSYNHFMQTLQGCEMERQSTPYVWLVLHIFLILMIFIGLAIICDDHFVPSLEVICDRLELSEDVAGATFMAAGSSAPELFTSLASVTADNEVGAGTIVGSAVFNILIIIALSAAFAKRVLKIDWRPLIRDSVFYAISITMFTIFVADYKIYIYEAIILLVMYVVYVVLMKFNPQLMKLMAGEYNCSRAVDNKVTPSNTPELDGDNDKSRSANNSKLNGLLTPDYSQDPRASDLLKNPSIRTASSIVSSETQSNREDENEDLLKHKLPSNREFSTRTVINKQILPKLQNQKFNCSFTNDNTIEDEQQSLETKKPLPPLFKSDCKVTLTNEESTGPLESVEDSGLEEHYKDRNVERVDEKAKKPENEEADIDEDDDRYSLVICSCMPSIMLSIPRKPEPNAKCLCWQIFIFVLRWILLIFSFPFIWVFSWTVPNCSTEKYKKYYTLTFILSIVWIAVLSFGMVILVSRTGCILSIDSYTMGLVIVAIGTSIPDALSSIFAVRDGHGDMAVSNAIGSNIFDINLGLGLPYLIRILIDEGKPYILHVTEADQFLDTSALPINPFVKFGIVLLIILILVLMIFVIVKFRLNRVIGISLVFLYAIFLVYAFIQDAVCKYHC